MNTFLEELETQVKITENILADYERMYDKADLIHPQRSHYHAMVLSYRYQLKTLNKLHEKYITSEVEVHETF